MVRAAGRLLAPAVLLTALVASPALGYATTFVLLGLMALAAVWWFATRQGRRATLPASLFASAFLFIALSSVAARAQPTPLLGFAGLLFYAPLARLIGGPGQSWPSGHQAALPALALFGTGIGLATALFLHFALGQGRAGEGFFLTDPYRLAVTTLLLATLALGAFFTRHRIRWLTPLGCAAALAVIALTGSRTALLGMPVLLLVTGLCLVRRPTAIAAVLVAGAALLLAALFVELPGTARLRLWDVMASLTQGGEAGDVAIGLRLALYRMGFEQFAASPLFGHGWSEANMVPILARLTPEQLSWGRIVHLHNDALQFALSGGLLGLAAWLLILLAPVVGYMGLPADAKGPARLHALLVLVVGYLVLGLPDLMLASPLQLTLYVTLTAAVLASTPATVSP